MSKELVEKQEPIINELIEKLMSQTENINEGMMIWHWVGLSLFTMVGEGQTTHETYDEMINYLEELKQLAP